MPWRTLAQANRVAASRNARVGCKRISVLMPNPVLHLFPDGRHVMLQRRTPRTMQFVGRGRAGLLTDASAGGPSWQSMSRPQAAGRPGYARW